MPGSYSHAYRDSAKDCSIKFYGIPEMKKQPDDLRTVSGVEVQIQKP